MPERRPYTFTETQRYLKGPFFNDVTMSAGIVVGKTLGIQYIGDESASIVIVQFVPIRSGTPTGEKFEEMVDLLKRYRYQGNGDGDMYFFIRGDAGKSRGAGLQFQVESRLQIVTARRLGINL